MLVRKLVFTAMAALLLCGCGGNERQSSETAVVHNVFVINPLPVASDGAVTLPAVVEEARTISVGFKTSGQIQRIYVKEGDRVRAGQRIAMLDTVDYALGISQLRERYAQMLAEHQRQTRLHAAGNMSDNDYEKAASGLRQLGLQLKLEENKLAYCQLSAPAAGVVTKVNFEVSEMVDAGRPVVELMDISALEAVVDLPVRMYEQREGFRGFEGIVNGSAFPMQMLSLTPRADNSQLYRLRLSAPSNLGLTSGMNINVRILSNGDGDEAVNVPLSAVWEKEGQTYVWTLTDSVTKATPVTVHGSGEGGHVTITSGLTTADVVVRAGVHHLVDGEKVNIL